MTCVHYQRWWNNDESHGTMKTGTSHLVYGETAADSTMVATTSTTMQNNRVPSGWGAAYFSHSNKLDDGSGGTDHTASTSLPYDTTTRYIPKRYQTSASTTMYHDKCAGGWGDYSHHNDKWGGTTMTPNSTSRDYQCTSDHQSRQHDYVDDPYCSYHSNDKHDNVWGDPTTTTNNASGPHQRVMGQQPPTTHDTTVGRFWLQIQSYELETRNIENGIAR